MACCENPWCDPHRYDPPTCRGGSLNADGSWHTRPAPTKETPDEGHPERPR